MYTQRIIHLEEGLKVLDKKIADLETSNSSEHQQLDNLREQKVQLRTEISRLRKLEWEEKHERVGWDDDR